MSKRELQATQRKIATTGNFLDTEWSLLYIKDANAAFWSDPVMKTDEDGRYIKNTQENFLNEATVPVAGDLNLLEDNRLLSEEFKEGKWNEVDYVAWLVLPTSIHRMGGWYWYFKAERENLIKNK
jgi:hypothetical protein